MTDPKALDLQTRILNSVVDHWPLVVGATVAFWWGFPLMLKKSMSNGGGEAFRAIVRSENEAQSEKHHEKTREIVDQAIRNHEVDEDRKLGLVVADIRDEITDVYPRRRAPRREKRSGR